MQSIPMDQMIFAGLNGRVMALNRDNGQIVWEWHSPKPRKGFIAVMLDGDRLIVGISGYLYCLEATTGRLIWQNPLTGYGIALFSFASVRGQAQQSTTAQYEADQQSSG
jgi:outer membrane protein assembly factor BamB